MEWAESSIKALKVFHHGLGSGHWPLELQTHLCQENPMIILTLVVTPENIIFWNFSKTSSVLLGWYVPLFYICFWYWEYFQNSQFWYERCVQLDPKRIPNTIKSQIRDTFLCQSWLKVKVVKWWNVEKVKWAHSGEYLTQTVWEDDLMLPTLFGPDVY